MISVVVACYNVEKYVEKAVRSVMNQTYKDIEIICVDDGSEDQTLSIIEQLSGEDGRIVIVKHEKNQGLLAVRCHGIHKARGEHITFLDGDDYLASDILEEALEVMNARDVDVVQFGTELFDVENIPQGHIDLVEKITTPYTDEIRTELVSKCFLERKFTWNVWGKIYKIENVRQAIQFYNEERLVMAEDMLLSFMFLAFSQGYAPVQKKGYYYRQGSGVTAIASHYSEKRIRMYSEEYQVYQLLDCWLTKLGWKGRYQESLEFVKKHVFTDLIGTITVRTAPESRCEAMKIMTEYWPSDELAAGIAVAIPWIDTWKNRAEMMWSLRKSEFLQVRPRPVKTIGTYYYRMYNGGVERVISKLIPIWQSSGYRVVLFTEEEANTLDYSIPEDVVRVIVPKADSSSFEDSEKRSKVWTQAIREHSIDVMVYHQWTDPQLMSDSVSIKSEGIPLILHTHGLFSQGLSEDYFPLQYLIAAQKKCYSLFDSIITLGEVDQAWWTALGYRSVLTVNPSTYELSQVKPAALQGKNVLWVGRLSEQKQVLEAFKVMRYVHEQVPDAKLVIVGGADSDKMLKRVEEYLAAHGMNEYVSLEGYRSDVRRYYENAALVLWTSSTEGMPMGMIEAKAYGLPIVCYELANVDMVRKPKGMRVVAQRDSVAAAKHVVELLEDEQLRIQLGKESRQSVEEMYAIDLGKHWESIFEHSMQPKAKEKTATELSPMEATAQLTMDFLAQGLDHREGVLAQNMEVMTEERKKTLQLFEELYLDGYFVKLYRLLNKLFPKGGKCREMLKKIASFFLR